MQAEQANTTLSSPINAVAAGMSKHIIYLLHLYYLAHLPIVSASATHTTIQVEPLTIIDDPADWKAKVSHTNHGAAAAASLEHHGGRCCPNATSYMCIH